MDVGARRVPGHGVRPRGRTDPDGEGGAGPDGPRARAVQRDQLEQPARRLRAVRALRVAQVLHKVVSRAAVHPRARDQRR